MTVYARSDVMSVALSDSHGGCGAAHHRPVTHGAPAVTWALTCAACENHLRHDPLWATMPADVPETPDEERVREDRDKRGTIDRDRLLSDAILALAGSHETLPAQLAQALLAAGGQVPGAGVSTSCPEGHVNRPGSRFCAECGVSLVRDEEDVTVVEAAVNHALEPEPRSGPEPEPTSPSPTLTDLQRLTVRDLRELSQQRGLEDTGNKARLIERLMGNGG